MRAVSAIIKRLFASNRVSFLVTAAVALCATTSGDSAIALSNGNYVWLLAAMTPFFFVFYDYPRLLHLGAGKRDYYLACLVSYGLTAFLISLVNTAIHALLDPLNRTQTVINLMDLCGWTANGMLAAFFQQAAFLLLTMIFLHVLLSMQPYWFGWLADAALVAVVCVFTPIATLRGLLAGFFRITMMNGNAPLHIGVCLLLGAALSFAGLVVLKRGVRR